MGHFTLDQVVPWGRSFDEYASMFALSGADLDGWILGCGDGPASFNAGAVARGLFVVSADPIYRFPGPEIRTRVEETAATIAGQLRQNAHEFVWRHFRAPDDLIAGRMKAMGEFLSHYDDASSRRRYVAATLPALPFASSSFDLALCSHFLFLYSEHHDEAFHLESLLELMRVAWEVRVFPLLELGGARSRHLDAVERALTESGLAVEEVPVPYEVQRGGDHMLRIQRRTPVR
jgi:hypothetical protein